MVGMPASSPSVGSAMVGGDPLPVGQAEGLRREPGVADPGRPDRRGLWRLLAGGAEPAAPTDEKEEKKDSRGKERPRSDLLVFLRAQDESALFPSRPRKSEHCYKPALTIP